LPELSGLRGVDGERLDRQSAELAQPIVAMATINQITGNGSAIDRTLLIRALAKCRARNPS
jgi:hypothetical protein